MYGLKVQFSKNFSGKSSGRGLVKIGTHAVMQIQPRYNNKGIQYFHSS